MSKYQPKGSPLCGPTALCNALYALGRKVSIQACINNCALDTHTDQFALMRGINEFQHYYSEFNSNTRKNAMGWLMDGTNILCVDDWSHWVVAYRIPSGLVQLVDSENVPRNKAHNGNQIVTVATALKRWSAAAKLQTDPTDRTYYGIKVWR